VHLFGGVDEEEEEREGARRGRAQLEGERRHLLEQRVEAGRRRVAAPAVAARLPQPLNGVERLPALQPADHPAERRGEPAHVLVERHVLAPRHRLGRNGESVPRGAESPWPPVSGAGDRARPFVADSVAA
jgi:hypothetical protein